MITDKDLEASGWTFARKIGVAVLGISALIAVASFLIVGILVKDYLEWSSDAASRRQSLETELSQIKKSNAELGAALEQYRSNRKESIDAEVKALSEQTKVYKTSLSDALKQRNSLESEIEQLNLRFNNLESERAACVEMDAQIKAKKAELANLEARSEQQKKELADSYASLTKQQQCELAAKQELLKAELATFQTNITADKRKLLDEFESENARLKKEHENSLITQEKYFKLQIDNENAKFLTTSNQLSMALLGHMDSVRQKKATLDADLIQQQSRFEDDQQKYSKQLAQLKRLIEDEQAQYTNVVAQVKEQSAQALEINKTLFALQTNLLKDRAAEEQSRAATAQEATKIQENLLELSKQLQTAGAEYTKALANLAKVNEELAEKRKLLSKFEAYDKPPAKSSKAEKIERTDDASDASTK